MDVNKMTDKEIKERLKQGKEILTVKEYEQEKILLKTELAKRKKDRLEKKLLNICGKCVLAEVLYKGKWTEFKTYILPNSIMVRFVYRGATSKYPYTVQGSVTGYFLIEEDGEMKCIKSYVNADSIKFNKVIQTEKWEQAIFEQFNGFDV